jgi:hypothetical protein
MILLHVSWPMIAAVTFLTPDPSDLVKYFGEFYET